MKSFVKDFNKSLILPNGIHENSEQKKIDFNLNFENYPFIEIMQYDSSKKEKDPFENIDFSKVVLGQELKIKTPFVI